MPGHQPKPKHQSAGQSGQRAGRGSQVGRRVDNDSASYLIISLSSNPVAPYSWRAGELSLRTNYWVSVRPGQKSATHRSAGRVGLVLYPDGTSLVCTLSKCQHLFLQLCTSRCQHCLLCVLQEGPQLIRLHGRTPLVSRSSFQKGSLWSTSCRNCVRGTHSIHSFLVIAHYASLLPSR